MVKIEDVSGRKIYDSKVDNFDAIGEPAFMVVGAEENIELFNIALPTMKTGEVLFEYPYL